VFVHCEGDPGSYEFMPHAVRDHVAAIVCSEELSLFPYARHCTCQGRAGGRMIACDRCMQWFHWRCISGLVFAAGRQWFCNQCRD